MHFSVTGTHRVPDEEALLPRFYLSGWLLVGKVTRCRMVYIIHRMVKIRKKKWEWLKTTNPTQPIRTAWGSTRPKEAGVEMRFFKIRHCRCFVAQVPVNLNWVVKDSARLAPPPAGFMRHRLDWRLRSSPRFSTGEILGGPGRCRTRTLKRTTCKSLSNQIGWIGIALEFYLSASIPVIVWPRSSRCYCDVSVLSLPKSFCQPLHGVFAHTHREMSRTQPEAIPQECRGFTMKRQIKRLG